MTGGGPGGASGCLPLPLPPFMSIRRYPYDEESKDNVKGFRIPLLHFGRWTSQVEARSPHRKGSQCSAQEESMHLYGHLRSYRQLRLARPVPEGKGKGIL